MVSPRVFTLLLILFAHIGLVTADEAPFRLPGTVVPLHYRLALEIVPDAPGFSGVAEIDVRIGAPVAEIWLHGQGLKVTEVALRRSDGASVAASYEQLTPDGIARVAFEDIQEPQQATLRFEYSAEFGASLNGLYKVAVGEDSYAFTQFESVFARKAFPSFDEPGYKTTYDISIATRAQYGAFTNTRVASKEQLPGDMQRVTYTRTLPLPTYLIAFAVGPLDVVEWAPVAASSVRDKPLPLRGIATRGQGARFEYALENTASLLLSLEDYFGTAYPFDKLDIVAVPDFASGAMENAGLITYREPLMLLGDKPGVNQVRFYALVHAHELAHQWFGNIVTMPWWDDIWLNEAFASWIQARTGQLWDPSFNFNRSIQARAIRAMREDSLMAARQIRQPVDATADIFNAFDSITYQKGAGVLQMLEHYLGPDNFRAALRAHMKKFAFGSADVYDLMESLANVAGDDKPVKTVFESFLFQPGVPYLNVRQDCDAQGRGIIHLAQQRFLPIGSAGDPAKTWALPVCFAYGGGDKRYERCTVLTASTGTVVLEDGGCPAWVMPNADGAGYYRWRLAGDDFNALRDVFGTRLNAHERISFVDSLVAGLESGDVAVDEFFAIMPTVIAARERSVVEAPLNMLQRIVEMLDGEAVAAGEYIAGLLRDRLAAIDQPGGAESPTEAALLRARLQRFLAVDLREADTRHQLKDAVYRSLGYPDESAPDPEALPPDLLRPALIVAVQDSDAVFLEFLLGQFNGASSRFRLAVMEALAHIDDATLAERTHEFVLTPAVRGNELDRWLDYSLKPDGYEINWPWIRENHQPIFAAGGDRLTREAPFSLGRWLCSRKNANVLRDMFTARLDDSPGIERNLARAVEQIELCVAFRARHADDAASFFSGIN